MPTLSKNNKIWIAFGESAALYLIFKFVIFK